jgi:hypothetical protein
MADLGWVGPTMGLFPSSASGLSFLFAGWLTPLGGPFAGRFLFAAIFFFQFDISFRCCFFVLAFP